MKDLIEALTIFAKYQKVNMHSPTHCSHDVFVVVGVARNAPGYEDRKRLKELSFHWDAEIECWVSFRFGRA